MKKKFSATLKFKVFLASCTTLLGLLALGSAWLWSRSGDSGNLIVSCFIGLGFLLLALRFLSVISNPIVEFDGAVANVLGWYKGTSKFDLGKEIDVAHSAQGIMLAQGRSKGFINKFDVGTESFKEIVTLFSETKK